MDSTAILSTIALVASVAGIIIGYVNHKKVAIRCCGKRRVVSIDIDDSNKPSPTDLEEGNLSKGKPKLVIEKPNE